MNIRERIYAASPVALQHLAVSYEGWKLARRRFGPGFRAALTAAEARAAWSSEALLRHQDERLRRLVAHAGQSSPYWRETFSRAGIDPLRFEGLAALDRIPFLDKATLRSRTEEVRSRAYDRSALQTVHTSGTTGTPITVGFTQADMQERFAILYRMLGEFGVRPFDRSVRFSGRTLYPGAERNKVFWRMNYGANQLFMSSYDLHPGNLGRYADKLAAYRPELIDGYPSSLYVLARSLNAAGRSGEIRPRLIATTAETLEAYQREEISRAFGGCPVVNQYASSEGAPFITENRRGELVLNLDSGIFEFLNPETGEAAGPGEIAELVVTSFTTHAYPLIRYRILDTVLLGPGAPSSTWAMPTVAQVIGRQEDIVYTPYKGWVGRLDPVFKKSPSSIVEAQIAQVAPTEFRFRYVADPETFSDDHLPPILEEMRARLGPVSVVPERCGTIARGRSGKMRAVVVEMAPAGHAGAFELAAAAEKD